MKICQIIYFAIGLCIVTTGCIPLPAKSVVHYGVKARLLEADSGMPIARRQVIVTVDDREFGRKTNRKGEFEIKPQTHFFFTWLGGPMWVNATRAAVGIALDGFTPYQKILIVRPESPGTQPPPDEDKLSGKYIVLGDVTITKLPLQRGPHGSGEIHSRTNPTALVDVSSR